LINNNRQQQQNRGRSRGRRPQGNSGGRSEGNSRIDTRARGNAPQMLEKYKNMARDAQLQGDRVMTEYYLQFSDHYFRIVAEQRARTEETRKQRDDWQEGDADGDEMGSSNASDSSDYDDDFGGDQPQQQPRRESRPRSDRTENGRDNNRDTGREANRDDRTNRDDRPAREERAPRASNRPDGNRADGNRAYGNRSNGNRDGNRDYGNRNDRDLGRDLDRDDEARPDTIDVAVLPPSFASDGPMTPIDDLIPSIDDVPAAPKRRGRPKKVELDSAES
jgi:Domain of unknown function (DUF4167)